MTLLHFDDLHISYQKQQQWVHAVQGVSLTLKAGSTMGIVGESGCGKSTLALAPFGLITAAHLRAKKLVVADQPWNGERLTRWRQRCCRSVGFVFQDPMTHLNPTMKIGSQIKESLYQQGSFTRKEAHKEACRLLELLEIHNPERCLAQYPFMLSGGMCQRVLLAIALSTSPKLLIADEPTTALDSGTQRQILELIKKIQQESNLAILLVSHDLGVIHHMCDDLAVMYGGNVVESGVCKELLRDPQHPYTQSLLAALPRLSGEPTLPSAIPGTPPDLSLPIQGCPFVERCSKALNICAQEAPPAFERGSTSRCWLHDPRAEATL